MASETARSIRWAWLTAMARAELRVQPAAKARVLVLLYKVRETAQVWHSGTAPYLALASAQLSAKSRAVSVMVAAVWQATG
jgi:hypothetical protein